MKRVFGGRTAAAGLTIVAGAAAALAIFGVFGAHGAVPRTGPLSVRAGLKTAPGPYVRADGLFDGHGGRTELGATVSGALTGPLSPVAVRSADGKLVAYNTWRQLRTIDRDRSFSKQGIGEGDALGTPSLRVHDDAGHDSLLSRGAYSAAWRRDGAIAFVQGDDPDFRAGRTYTGQIVVRRGIRDRDVPWTTEAAHYVVYAWAGDRLLFYRVGLGEKLELRVADGPGKTRPLADGSAIALNPDGTRVAVVSQDATNVRVLDVATGRELSWLDVTTTTPALTWVAYSGSWVGDHVVAPASAGLVVFHVGSDSLELEQVLSLDRAQFPVGVQEPRFVDNAGNAIAALADIPPAGGGTGESFFLQCDRIARSCERGAVAPASDWLRPVADEGGR
jgi:DNA-binding beta-propeller fold protein YncE